MPPRGRALGWPRFSMVLAPLHRILWGAAMACTMAFRDFGASTRIRPPAPRWPRGHVGRPKAEDKEKHGAEMALHTKSKKMTFFAMAAFLNIPWPDLPCTTKAQKSRSVPPARAGDFVRGW